MKKEYRIIFHKSPLLIFCFVGLLLISLGSIYMVFAYRSLLPILLLIATLPFVYLLGFYTPRSRIIIDEDKLIFKYPDRTIEVNIKDIYKIDRELGWGGVDLYNIYYMENGKRKLTGFSEKVQGYQEILDYIEQRRPKDHPASKEGPIKKFFRRIFLIIMYTVLFGVPIILILMGKWGGNR